MINFAKEKLHQEYHYWQYKRAKRAFLDAIPYQLYLPEDKFDQFVRQYGARPAGPAQDYSLTGMEAQAAERVKFAAGKTRKHPSSVLEIGPGAGFVLKRFKEQGISRAVALDIVDSLYPQVKQAGVELVRNSADDMQCIPDGSFDLIVSWSALEHIPNPQRVFEECLRILAPGGYLYLQFGPLYYSPWGYHHYSVLRCPYLHLLFPGHIIHEYAKQKKGEDYRGYLPWTNGEPLESYGFMKKGLPYGYLLESFHSGFDCYSAGFILRYPGIFKAKNVAFDSFFVDNMAMGVYRDAE